MQESIAFVIEKTFSGRQRVKTLQRYRFSEISINKTCMRRLRMELQLCFAFISMMATFLSLSLIVVNLSVKCGSFFTDIHRLDIAHWNICGHGNSFFVDIVIKRFSSCLIYAYVRFYTHTHSRMRTCTDVEKRVETVYINISVYEDVI